LCRQRHHGVTGGGLVLLSLAWKLSDSFQFTFYKENIPNSNLFQPSNEAHQQGWSNWYQEVSISCKNEPKFLPEVNGKSQSQCFSLDLNSCESTKPMKKDMEIIILRCI